MNCKNAHKLLLNYLDGDLPENKKGEIQNHLNSCNNCVNALNNLVSVYGIISKEKEEYQTNYYFANKIVNKLQANTGQLVNVSIPIRRISIVTIAAAGIALGIGIGSILNTTLLSKPSNPSESLWIQLADDYFPSDVYSPYEDIIDNE